MTIGKDIETKIRDTLRESRNKGVLVVPCTTLWLTVGKNRRVSDPFYGRYKSVLQKLLLEKTVKMHKDEEEGTPKGFELLTH